MRLRAALSALPEGYEIVRGRRGVLAVERSARAELERAGFAADGGERLAASDLSGRAPLSAIEAQGERWIVRCYRHGGLFRALGERLYLTPARPFLELTLARALAAAGVATPRVIAARAVRTSLVGWRLALVSARIEGACDAAELLERLRSGELEPARRAHFAREFGALVGQLHGARFLHADLNPRNVLFASDLGARWILDLDRGRVGRILSAGERRDNLRRLYRSVRRRERRGRAFLTRGDYLRFLRAYQRARTTPGGAAPDWRADWRAIVRRDRALGPLHRIGWRLETLLGDGPEHRDGAATVR